MYKVRSIIVGDVEEGVILGFNDFKNCGLIKSKSGEDFFFHYNDGRDLTGKEPVLIWAPFPDDVFMKKPEIGDQVVFKRGFNKQGLKAFPWSRMDIYERVMKI
jgi:hypothetical protein